MTKGTIFVVAGVILAGAWIGNAAEPDGSPPMVPHQIADFSTSATQNDCMMCHGPASGMEGVKPAPAESHLSNGVPAEGMSDCKQCHVAKPDAPSIM